jgi:hypothetical protein
VGRRPFSDQQTDAGPKRRWLRIFAIALGGIGFVLGAIYVAVVVAFPPARLAVLLADQVKAATGREFRIDGGLSIRVLPSIAIQVRDVVLGNAAWGSRVDMATVRRAAIDVSPGALLKGELRILRIDVEGVDALLEADGAGRYNWQFTPPTSPAADTKPAPADGQAPWFDLKRVVASDVLVAYRDGSKSPPQTLTIESLDLRSNDREIEIALALAIGKQRWKGEGQVGRGAILLEGKEDWPFDLRLTGDGATVSAKGAIGTGERAGTAVADVSAELASAAALAPLGSDAARVPMPLALRARVRHAGRELRADPLHVSIAGQTLDGRMTLNTAQPRPRVDAALTSKLIDLTKLGPVTSMTKPGEPGRPPGRRLGRGSPTPPCCSPPFPVSTSTSSSRRRACDFQRRRCCQQCAPVSRRPLVGSCSTTSSSGSLADGSAAGQISCSLQARRRASMCSSMRSRSRSRRSMSPWPVAATSLGVGSIFPRTWRWPAQRRSSSPRLRTATCCSPPPTQRLRAARRRRSIATSS